MFLIWKVARMCRLQAAVLVKVFDQRSELLVESIRVGKYDNIIDHSGGATVQISLTREVEPCSGPTWIGTAG